MYDNSIEVENIQVIPDRDPMKQEIVENCGKKFNSRPYVSGEDFDCDILIWRGFDPYYCPQWNELSQSIMKCKGVKVLRNIKSMDCCKTFTEFNQYFWKATSRVMDCALYTDQGNDDLMMRNFGYKNIHEYPFVIDQEFIDIKSNYDNIDNKVIYGYAGYSHDRLYEYTAIFGNMITDGLPIKKVAIVTDQHKRNDPESRMLKAWTLDEIEALGTFKRKDLINYMQSSLFAVHGGIGRFGVECMAVGLPSFGDIMPYKEDNKFSMPGFGLFTRNDKEKQEMAKKMLINKDYRIELGEQSRRFASKFGVINQRIPWKETLEWCLNLKR